MKTYAIVLGTRPEAVKLLPVWMALRGSDRLGVELISTGQHREMLDQVLDLYDVRPDVSLDIMTQNQSLADLTATVLTRLDAWFSGGRYQGIIVQGDTTTCFAASLVSFYRKIPLFHVEAGLRTGDIWRPFPEEFNRRATSLLARLHFAPTETARLALAAEGIQAGVHVVGNTVIDSLFHVRRRVQDDLSRYQRRFASYLTPGQPLVLITGHRRESFGQGFENICTAIQQLAALFPNYVFLYPVHLNPNVRGVVSSRLQGLPNVHLLDPVPYDELVYLLLVCHIVLTDSGGIQEEAPSLGKPVLVLRETTERPEGVAAGCCELVGTDPDRIVSSFTRLATDPSHYARMSQAQNPYGDGLAASRIRKLLEQDAER
ncbi:MAG: UDP-N-acetylglucosamine 2-epimerase (non-hydrolyzing) [Myxococcales bacterium]|nr:UDP-N-acetylglucosamine 2-epimerase (non-hydrolyzing) [Polyangiaceae bacterium]MDW8250491.1 UDP-N-acetylglucosamine 2-epimerase (non-hydrolyzing) [Myxococcales bacterium]